jgi:hypothetical protein
MLEHHRTECTGEWRLVEREGRGHFVCEACGALHLATPARRKAAVDEILAGTVLRQLADEGANRASDLDDAA